MDLILIKPLFLDRRRNHQNDDSRPRVCDSCAEDSVRLVLKTLPAPSIALGARSTVFRLNGSRGPGRKTLERMFLAKSLCKHGQRFFIERNYVRIPGRKKPSVQQQCTARTSRWRRITSRTRTARRRARRPPHATSVLHLRPPSAGTTQYP